MKTKDDESTSNFRAVGAAAVELVERLHAQKQIRDNDCDTHEHFSDDCDEGCGHGSHREMSEDHSSKSARHAEDDVQREFVREIPVSVGHDLNSCSKPPRLRIAGEETIIELRDIGTGHDLFSVTPINATTRNDIEVVTVRAVHQHQPSAGLPEKIDSARQTNCVLVLLSHERPHVVLAAISFPKQFDAPHSANDNSLAARAKMN